MFKKNKSLVEYHMNSNDFNDRKELFKAMRDVAQNNPDKVIKVKLPGNCSLVATPIDNLENETETIENMLDYGPRNAYIAERKDFLSTYARAFNDVALAAIAGSTACYHMIDGTDGYNMKSELLNTAVNTIKDMIPVIDEFEAERDRMEYDFNEILSLENSTY